MDSEGRNKMNIKELANKYSVLTIGTIIGTVLGTVYIPVVGAVVVCVSILGHVIHNGFSNYLEHAKEKFEHETKLAELKLSELKQKEFDDKFAKIDKISEDLKAFGKIVEQFSVQVKSTLTSTQRFNNVFQDTNI